MKYLHLTFFVLFFYCLNGQNIDFSALALDSLIPWVTEHVEIYEDSTQSYQAAHLALDKSQALEDPIKIATCYTNLATWHSYHYYISMSDSLIYYDTLALSIYQNLQDSLKIASTLSVIASDYSFLQKSAQAENAAIEAAKIYEAIGDLAGASGEYLILSDIYNTASQDDDALKYALLGEKILRDINNRESLAYAALSTVYIHLKDDNVEKALKLSSEAISIFDSLDISDNTLMKAYNCRAHCYKQMGQLDGALKDFMFAWKGAVDLFGGPLGDGYAHFIGEIYQLKGECQNAIPYFLKGLKYAEDYDVGFQLQLRHEQLADCYEQTDQTAKALESQKIAYALKDTTYDQRIKSLKSELLVKYETSQKEQIIEQQKASIFQSSRIQKLTWAIIGLLGILISGLLWVFTKNKKTNYQLSKLNIQLSEKNKTNQTLLKEIHHRVKNNLQILSSLLSLQSDSLENENAIDALSESRNRVESMGLIHQRLYTNDDITSVNIKTYISELCRYLEDSFSSEDRSFKIVENVTYESIDVDYAIPLGLIINELVTNATKYAFKDRSDGILHLQLSESANGLELVVSDNGHANDISNNLPIKESFGSQLIRTLSKKMKGVISIDTDNGYKTKIIFKRYSSLPEIGIPSKN